MGERLGRGFKFRRGVFFHRLFPLCITVLHRLLRLASRGEIEHRRLISVSLHTTGVLLYILYWMRRNSVESIPRERGPQTHSKGSSIWIGGQKVRRWYRTPVSPDTISAFSKNVSLPAGTCPWANIAVDVIEIFRNYSNDLQQKFHPKISWMNSLYSFCANKSLSDEALSPRTHDVYD